MPTYLSRIGLLLALFLLTLHLRAQVVTGRVFDNKKEPMINARVYALQNKTVIAKVTTDYDGNFIFSNLDTGQYDLSVAYEGFDQCYKTGVIVTNGKTNIEFTLSRNKKYIAPIIIMTTCPPAYDRENPTKKTFRRTEINQMPH